MAELGFGDLINALAGGVNVASGIANLFGANKNTKTLQVSRQSDLERRLLETAGIGQQIGLDAIGYAAGPNGAYRRQPTQEEAMRQQFSNQLVNAISGRVGGWGQLNMGGGQQTGAPQGGSQQGGGLRDRQSLVNAIQQRMGTSNAPAGTPPGISQQLQQILQQLGLNTTSGG